MRKLLNTLYISTNQLYLSLENSNVVVKQNDGSEVNRIPLHMLESIVSFSRRGLSIPLISRCSRDGIPIYLMSETGSLLASISMPSRGNIFLRKSQYRLTENEHSSTRLAATFVEGKLLNMKHVLDRFIWGHRNHPALKELQLCSAQLGEKSAGIRQVRDLATLRGLEGDATADYFRCFRHLIRNAEGAGFARYPKPVSLLAAAYRTPCSNVSLMPLSSGIFRTGSGF